MLRYAYVHDYYYGDPAVLIVGDEKGLRNLASLFAGYPWPELGNRVDLAPFMDNGRPGFVVLSAAAVAPGGIKRLSENKFDWQITAEASTAFTEKLSGFRDGHPKHAFLDSETDDANVIASIGEAVEGTFFNVG